MALTGKQKAAMLLMNLDAPTAAELLKGVDPALVQELAVEVAYLDVSGIGNNHSVEVARQFYQSLEISKKFDIQNFIGTMLKSSIGSEKAERIQSQIQELLHKRDPFIPIRSADSRILAGILGKEHPQAAAVVLTELPPRKSSEILSLFEGGFRFKVVSRMAMPDPVPAEARMRIAQMVCSQLEAKTPEAASSSTGSSEQASRRVAVMLRNLSKEIRDGLLSSITQKDAEAGKMISELMVIWEDIPEIADRSLQNAMRSVDAKMMALAFINADETIIRKIKTNISERAAATIEEEASLLSSPKKADIEQARVDIVQVLREINQKGELNFTEE
jgi:flagellar motor switch protein FliG